MATNDAYIRRVILRCIVLGIFLVLAGRVGYLQLFDAKYKRLAAGNVLRYEVQYAPRGEIVDRNGEFLVQSRECYDLMVTYREMNKRGFDTMLLCNLVDMTKEQLIRKLNDARSAPRKAMLITNYIPKEVKVRLDEYKFPGFHTVYRTARQYPRKIAGNLLGYVGEVNKRDIERQPDVYKAGDYIGVTGLEAAYEEELRGMKGVKVLERDTHGAIKGSYMNGAFD